MSDTPKGMSIRDAVTIALEAIPGSIDATLIDLKTSAVRDHVVGFIKEFARNRGVLFDDKDILDDVNAVITERRAIAITRTKTPR